MHTRPGGAYGAVFSRTGSLPADRSIVPARRARRAFEPAAHPVDAVRGLASRLNNLYDMLRRRG
jgi:hypothetical protein